MKTFNATPVTTTNPTIRSPLAVISSTIIANSTNSTTTTAQGNPTNTTPNKSMLSKTTTQSTSYLTNKARMTKAVKPVSIIDTSTPFSFTKANPTPRKGTAQLSKSTTSTTSTVIITTSKNRKEKNRILIYGQVSKLLLQQLNKEIKNHIETLHPGGVKLQIILQDTLVYSDIK
jgi:hypothetical protein